MPVWHIAATLVVPDWPSQLNAYHAVPTNAAARFDFRHKSLSSEKTGGGACAGIPLAGICVGARGNAYPYRGSERVFGTKTKWLITEERCQLGR